MKNLKPYTAPFWLKNRHAQTIWSQKLRRTVKVKLERERFRLPDADFVDVDWVAGNRHQAKAIGLILPGLGGNMESRYAPALLSSLAKRGWACGLLHFRGSSGEPNHFAHSYHAGAYGDLLQILKVLKSRHPNIPLFAVGISLGGSILLNGLGRNKEMADLLTAAVAVSVPYVLQDAATALDSGFSRFYQRYLLNCQKRLLKEKFKRVAPPKGIRLQLLDKARNFFQFDDWFTAPLHGFKGVDEYYNACSASQYLKNISTPTLLVHAVDDPFMSIESLPAKHQLSPAIETEFTKHGGHVGFISGNWPWKLEYWLEKRIPVFLQPHLKYQRNR
ncbi:MAG: hydrolase [Gammaproteobacteria bacterium]|nr:hydrolase [Gammaproteobacteria bacterium]